MYRSRRERVLDQFGLTKLVPFGTKKVRIFEALNGINLEIKAGERIGLIGRNGAGKSTLLKIISRSLAPTSGNVYVKGRVQALFESGVGFHQEFTGYENIRASLIYNNLSAQEVDAATKDVIDFVELGDFLNQPVKNYSLGMYSRLAFAASTAIRPEILIVDEVLSAGDAYFASKSVERMRKLVESGMTLLLVSHSMPQVQQFCDKVVWMDKGRIVEYGPTLPVIKNYERFNRELENGRLAKENQTRFYSQKQPDSKQVNSVSRWCGLGGLKVKSFRMQDAEKNDRWSFNSGDRVFFNVEIESDSDRDYRCQFAMNIYTLDGRMVALHCSDYDSFALRRGESKTVIMTYDKLLLGEGEYVISFAVYKDFDFNRPDEAQYYDLLDRSFLFKVFRGRSNDSSLFVHPGIWQLPSGNQVADEIIVS